MDRIKMILAVCLLGAAAACNRSLTDQLLGNEDASSGGEIGSPVNPGAPLNVELMSRVATDIAKDLAVETGFSPFASKASSFAAGCSSGPITTSSTTVSIPPATYGSSRTYTVNGTMYFSANNYHNSGGTIVTVQELAGTCLNKRLIYGTLAVEGGSYIQWVAADGITHYRWFRYTYRYKYEGAVLVVEGNYSVKTESGETTYPVKWVWKL